MIISQWHRRVLVLLRLLVVCTVRGACGFYCILLAFSACSLDTGQIGWQTSHPGMNNARVDLGCENAHNSRSHKRRLTLTLSNKTWEFKNHSFSGNSKEFGGTINKGKNAIVLPGMMKWKSFVVDVAWFVVLLMRPNTTMWIHQNCGSLVGRI